MGKHFGELATIRGIVYYKLSPYEQKAFAKAVSYGLPNFVPRAMSRMIYWLPPFVVGYFTYQLVEAGHKASLRKNPRDFIDEVDPNAIGSDD